MPVFHELIATPLRVPVLAHPAYAGATRVAPAFLLGKWFRLLGADAVIYPNYGGRFAYSRSECGAIADASRAPWAPIRAAMPVPAGGMTVDRVTELIAFYGTDTMLLIGGSLLQAGDALLARTRDFVARVHAGADGAREIVA
jgi:ribulose-bisphosphate carboxylase large chain